MAEAASARATAPDPRESGLDPDAVAALVERARRDVEEGWLPSCQLALARDGRVAFSTTIGDAPPDARYVIFSCTKALVAGAVWILVGDGLVDVSARVVDVVPEFGTNGKDTVTIEQVLLHTSGFPRAPLGPPDWADRAHRLERFSQWRLNWEPGTRYEYHATSAHWVLAEIIERVSGMDYRAFVRSRITEPLGITGLQLGVPPEEQGDIVDLVGTGSPATSDELMAALGIPELPGTEVTEDALLGFNSPEARAVGVPGAGAVSTAADLALYYQALLHDPLGIWAPAVLADVTTHVRNTMPDYLGTPANRSLGLVIAGDDGKAARRGFGHTVSSRAFGHDGAGGQIAWADPDTGLSFCYLTNGLERHQLREWRRSAGIASRAGNCVA
jgi:CubicO group peptidase (beta-lactamase class C family)